MAKFPLKWFPFHWREVHPLDWGQSWFTESRYHIKVLLLLFFLLQIDWHQVIFVRLLHRHWSIHNWSSHRSCWTTIFNDAASWSLNFRGVRLIRVEELPLLTLNIWIICLLFLFSIRISLMRILNVFFLLIHILKEPTPCTLYFIKFRICDSILSFTIGFNCLKRSYCSNFCIELLNTRLHPFHRATFLEKPMIWW